MSVDLVLSGIMVSLVTPTAVELSHLMVVLGCGHPILITYLQNHYYKHYNLTVSLVKIKICKGFNHSHKFLH